MGANGVSNGTGDSGSGDGDTGVADRSLLTYPLPPGTPAEGPQSHVMSYLMLTAPTAAPTAETLNALFAEALPGAPPPRWIIDLEASAPGSAEAHLASIRDSMLSAHADATGAFFVLHRGTFIMVTLVSVPLPVPQFAYAWANSQDGSLTRSDLEGHGAHWVVAALGTGKDMADQAARARAVAEVVAALSGLGGALAIHQPDAHVAWAAGPFRDQAAAQVDRPDSEGIGAMLGLWVNFQSIDGDTFRRAYRIDPEDAPPAEAAGLVTNGVRLFCGREIEFVPTTEPRDFVLSRVIMLIEWMLRDGPVVKNFETFGVSAEEQIGFTLEPGHPVVTRGSPAIRLRLLTGQAFQSDAGSGADEEAGHDEAAGDKAG